MTQQICLINQVCLFEFELVSREEWRCVAYLGVGEYGGVVLLLPLGCSNQNTKHKHFAWGNFTIQINNGGVRVERARRKQER